MDISIKFGKAVRAARLEKGMSQVDLALKLKVDASYVSKIERGIQNMSLKGVEKIAMALSVPVKNLIG
jgi:transcriptional regulator with XRE-family HTH domain